APSRQVVRTATRMATPTIAAKARVASEEVNCEAVVSAITHHRRLTEVEAKDAQPLDSFLVVAAPFCVRDFIGSDAPEPDSREEAGGAILAGASEHELELSRARLRDHLFDQLGGNPLALEAGQRIERGDLARVVAPVRIGQERADAGQVLVADAI